ncbi:hypothetical protein THRCLA_02827 [Thraustotheca clavata]|uniref:Uncharacterized protein n=1 Tax=Thraustotheca clavata TaxID=74557 RepID=A0A1W0A412_9STRA|nr:hypothetical protein THRCLA_02827 [Thraustotheca clavata]
MSNSLRPSCHSCESTSKQSKRIMPKSVTFTIETTYLFDVDVNGSALPKESGPPIGLAKTHFSIEIQSLDGLIKSANKVRKFDHLERIQILKRLYDAKTLALFCYDAIDTRKGRIETEEEDLRNARCLRARRRKRAAEMSRPVVKRHRIMPMMEYDDDESDEE